MAKGINLSTIGVKFGWAVGTDATTRPTSFTQIRDCVAIAGIALSADTIDVTPLENKFREYVEGIKDTGGTWDITFNFNSVSVADWETLRTASQAGTAANKATWACIWIPNFAKSFYVKFTPGEIPMPEFSVGSAFQGAISCTVNSYEGLQDAIEPKE